MDFWVKMTFQERHVALQHARQLRAKFQRVDPQFRFFFFNVSIYPHGCSGHFLSLEFHLHTVTINFVVARPYLDKMRVSSCFL